MSTASGSKASSTDHLTLPLAEMRAIISRFHERVAAAFQNHPASKESVRKALNREGAERCLVRLKRLSVDVILRYNQEREHSGKYCFGKTPMQTFLDSTHLAREKMLDRLTVGDASDTAGLRAAPERSPQERSAGAARLTVA